MRRPRDEPLIRGLFEALPPAGATWPSAQRALWLDLADKVLTLIYGGCDRLESSDGMREIPVGHHDGGSTP